MKTELDHKSNPARMSPKHYRFWLQNEFIRRCQKNPAYSIRAYAQSLGINSSSLSQILSGKRNASEKMIAKFCERIGVEPSLKKEVTHSSRVSKQQRLRREKVAVQIDYHQISLDAFAVISEWFHFALLELTFIKDFSSKPADIARCLGITADEARIAIDRLVRLGLLKQAPDGTLSKSKASITNFGEEITSPALRALQRQVLEKALHSLESDPVSIRDMSSMTMAIDIKNMDRAKEMITRFRRELCSLLEDGERTQVYHLGIQLYPVSKELNPKGE